MRLCTCFGILGLLGVLATAACGRGGFGPSPCTGQRCSGRGTCVETLDGQLQCACDPGYRPQGSTRCVVDPAYRPPGQDAGAGSDVTAVDLRAADSMSQDVSGDASMPDAGGTDARAPDAGGIDARARDAGVDARMPDAGGTDARAPDASEIDARARDGGVDAYVPPLCARPVDCDDADPATFDLCRAGGSCDHVPSAGVPLEGIADIALGDNHGCALIADGTVFCWGDNTYGQVGDGTNIDRFSARQVVGLENVTAICAGDNHSCALLADSTMRCWGRNNQDRGGGQLGDGTEEHRNSPVEVVGLSGVGEIACGQYNTCAAMNTGKVMCWGRNDALQVGVFGGGAHTVPEEVLEIDNAQGVELGHVHSCALLGDRTVKCWGYNNSGQVGDPALSGGNILPPVTVVGLSDVTQVSVGRYYALALRSNHELWAWGRNDYYQLTLVPQTNYWATPTLTHLPAEVVEVTAGRYHACAIMGSGEVQCWGSNEFQQIAAGELDMSATPVTVHGVDGAVHVRNGGFETCAVLDTQRARCWGRRDQGALSYNPFGLGRVLPFELSLPGDAIAQIQTTSRGSCALSRNAELWCWGGVGAVPAHFDALAGTVSQVAMGASHTCAVVAGGRVMCWGSGSQGQLGNGDTQGSATPVEVLGLAGVAVLSAGANHSCAIDATAHLHCWGDNASGQLGIGNTTDQSLAQAVDPARTWEHAAAGASHTCAVASGGAVFCWGADDAGQLGDAQPTTTSQHLPMPVPGLPPATQVAAEARTSCALLVDGDVMCWGDNGYGQVGSGSAANAVSSPEPVAGLHDVVAVDVGLVHACGLTRAGELWCWGLAAYGQQGVASLEDFWPVPARIELLGHAVDTIAVGRHQTFAVTSTGIALGWGDNRSGQLGTGDGRNASAPVDLVYVPMP